MRPRVAPAPCGSGISVRRLPEPSLVSIIEACQHYEEKSAGQQDSKSPVARNLYALSREVQDMVRSLKGGEDALAARVAQLEGVLREWNEVFASPSSALQRAGITRACSTPAALAQRCLALAAALQDSQAAALASSSALEREVLDLRTALRDSGRVVREQGARELRELAGQAEAVIASERAARAAAQLELAGCKASMAQEVQLGIAAGVAAATRELRARCSAAEGQAAAAQAEAGAASAAAEAAEQQGAAALATQRAAAAQLQGASSAREEEAVRGAVAAQRALAEARAAWQAQLADTEAQWRRKWEESNSAWERSTGAARAGALEAQVAFLSGRVRELQELAQAMQTALGGGGGEGTGTGAEAVEEPTQPVNSSSGSSGSGSRGVRGGGAARGRQAAPWRTEAAFGAAPVIVRHGSLKAAGEARRAVATAYFKAN